MSVYKRDGSPFWQASFLNPTTGERERASTRQTTQRAAKAWLEEHLDELRREAKEVKEGGRTITLAAALALYVSHLESAGKVSSSMWAGFRAKVLGTNPRMAARFHLDGRRPLHTLEPLDLERIVMARQAEGNMPQTIVHELQMLRAASRYVRSLRYRAPDLDITGGRNPWRMPHVVQKTRYLSWDEWLRVYTALDPDRDVSYILPSGRRSATYRITSGRTFESTRDARDLLVALTMCGARWGEVARLQWSKVSLTPLEDIEAALLADPAAPIIYGSLSIKGSKGGTERPVPMPEQFAQVLRRRRAAAAPDELLVFPSEDGGVRLRSSSAIRRAIDRAGCNSADMVRDYGTATVHSLRHTFASWAVQNGADLSEVQEVLGHSTMQMTRRYVSLSKRRTVEKLGGLMTALGRPSADVSQKRTY